MGFERLWDLTCDIERVLATHGANQPLAQQVDQPGHNLGELPLDHVQQLRRQLRQLCVSANICIVLL